MKIENSEKISNETARLRELAVGKLYSAIVYGTLRASKKSFDGSSGEGNLLHEYCRAVVQDIEEVVVQRLIEHIDKRIEAYKPQKQREAKCQT